jgi:hypothetical protein
MRSGWTVTTGHPVPGRTRRECEPEPAHSTLHGVVFAFLCLDACGVPPKRICTASGGTKSLNADADALQEQDVGDALHRAAPDDRKYAQLVSVVEHGSEIGTELHTGAE